MENENDHVPPPTRDQFERRGDFVRAYDRWRDKYDPERKLKQKARLDPEYQRAQYAKHREKRLAAKREEYARRRDELVERGRKWREDHLEIARARDNLRNKTRTEAGYQKEQYDKHREKRLAEKKAEYETNRDKLLARQAQWREGNRDKLKARDDRRYRENRAAFYANNWLRRRAMVAAAPPWLTKEHWEAIADVYVEAKRMTEETGVPHIVDHIWPLRGKHSCGLHVPWNLQVITSKENGRKSNREPSE